MDREPAEADRGWRTGEVRWPEWGRTGVTISRHRVWNQIIAPRRTTACLFGTGYPAHTIKVVRGSLPSAGFASTKPTLHPSAASLCDFSVIGPMQICPPVLGILPLESLRGSILPALVQPGRAECFVPPFPRTRTHPPATLPLAAPQRSQVQISWWPLGPTMYRACSALCLFSCPAHAHPC